MTVCDIYKLHVASTRHPSVLGSGDALSFFDREPLGAPLPTDWRPPEFRLQGSSHKLADALAWPSPRPLVSERAMRVILSVAGSAVEFRRFGDIKGYQYFVLNVLASENILDQQNSEVGRTEGGKVFAIYRYSFLYTGQETASPLFVVEGQPTSAILCTRAIPEAVVLHGLSGFCFRDPARNEIRDLFLGQDTNCFPGVIA